MPATDRATVQGWREEVDAQVQRKRYYASFGSAEERERQLREAARLRANARKLVEDAARIEDALAHWREQYDAADARVLELRALIDNVEHQDELARLQRVAEEILALSETGAR